MLLNLREENSLVDFKVAFHSGEEREWLEITKDIIAFANTNGGYLTFGVEDGSFQPIGLDQETANALCDPNNLQQKVNRFVEPQIASLRCKRWSVGGKAFVAVLIPPSVGKTHIISKNGAFKFPSGQEKVVLRQGTSYVRRSGANHLLDARDLDDIINRRIDHFKESLLSKIARVVEAPQGSEVFVVTPDPTAEANTKFIVVNSPGAIPVKGMSFTVSPATMEQEIVAWIAMTARDQQAIPPSGIVWKWYRARKSIQLGSELRVHVAMYCLLSGVPTFFWLMICAEKEIKPMLVDALSRRIDVESVSNTVAVGGFLGKRFHKSLLGKLGDYAERLGRAERIFPINGPRTYFRAHGVTPRGGKLVKKQDLRKELEGELDEIAESGVGAAGHQPALTDRWRAQTLDCYLYAQDDKYVIAKSE